MEEPDPISLSALQHWGYCPRQCALIHIEQAFDENLHTQHGRALHAQVDRPGVEVLNLGGPNHAPRSRAPHGTRVD